MSGHIHARERTIIVEDEPLARATLRDYSAAEGLFVVAEAADGVSAIELIDTLEPAIVFLDIELPECSGLDVLERIQSRPHVVFTTAYDQHAITAFEFEAVDYLLKPITRERFRDAVERVRRRIAATPSASGSELGSTPAPAEADHRSVNSPSRRVREALARRNEPLTRLFARIGDRLHPVLISEVSRLEAADDYVVLHVNDRRLHVAITLTQFEQRLDPTRFRRVHRQHIVNLDYIAGVVVEDRRLRLAMRDGTQVYTSRAGAHALRDLIA